MFAINYRKTISTLFLVRPLGIMEKREVFEEGLPETAGIIKNKGFTSAYLRDIDHPTTLSHPIFLLFRPLNLTTFDKFINEEYSEGNLTEDYDYEGGYVVLLYQFPEIYFADYEKIIAGKYSRVSSKFKSCFPFENPSTKEPNLYFHVFEKSEQLRKSIERQYNTILSPSDEMWNIPDMEKETLNIKKIQENEERHI